jgi:hypothetical protein
MALGQQHADRRNFQHVVELGLSRKRTEGHGNAAGNGCAEYGGQPLGAVGHQDADTAVFAAIECEQCTRHLHRMLPEIGVSPAHDAPLFAEHQRLARSV